MKVPFFDPLAHLAPLEDDLVRAFRNVLRSGNYIRGEACMAFEQAYASYLGTRHAIGVGNGTDALHIALRTLGVGPGDEVIVPANTYIATFLAVVHAGAVPVPAEPDPATHCLDPAAFEAAITPRTKAVIPVHLYGRPCPMDPILAIARRHSLHVVEDNAQAQGALYRGRRTGSFGAINATSFYPTKNLGTLGDGGMITTDDEELASAVRSWSNFGSSVRGHHERPGYNSRLDEVHAALLKALLPHLDAWNTERRAAAARYDDALNGVGDIAIPTASADLQPVHHLYVITTRHRDMLMQYLSLRDIGTLVHYPIPPHLQPALSAFGWRRGQWPIAEELARTVISLPLYPGLEAHAQAYVIDSVRNFFKGR